MDGDSDPPGPTSHSHPDFFLSNLPCRFLFQDVFFFRAGVVASALFFCLLIPVMGLWVCAEIRYTMRDRRETTSLGQYTRGSAKTGRVHSTQAVNAMRVWYRQSGYIVQANATTHTVARGMRILACSD